VLAGEIDNIDYFLDRGMRIKEYEIVEKLLPDLEAQLLLIGQSRGKFGGGRRKPFRVTQRKTEDGSKPKFSVMAIVGNRNGYIGIGFGTSSETMPAREKAIKNAKLNVIKIKRGCGSWQCGCKSSHSIPFKISGRSGSVRLDFMPAPKGTGLAVHSECRKILELAGIKDVWGRSVGQTRKRINLVNACFSALKNLQKTITMESFDKGAGVVEGRE
jgi:small subunit ribosomal protein S5